VFRGFGSDRFHCIVQVQSKGHSIGAIDGELIRHFMNSVGQHK
jgi:imidazoleglycerol phosphate dehydratase HisB